MIPCIGDVWRVAYGGGQGLVLVTNVTIGCRIGYEECTVTYRVLSGNGEGRTDWDIINSRTRWRWRKVTD